MTTLTGLLNLLGLGNLGSGDSITLTLTNILSGLGLDTNVNLNSLNLDQVLSAFGLNPTADVGLVGFLNGVGLSSLTSESLGSLLRHFGQHRPATSSTASSATAWAFFVTPVETLLKTVLDGALAGDLNVTVGTLLGGANHQ